MTKGWAAPIGETPAQRRARLKREHSDHLLLLQRKQSGHDQVESEKQRFARERREAQMAAIRAGFRGLAFREWYETTTGTPVADWLAAYDITFDEFVSRHPLWKGDIVGWWQQAIEQIAERHRWSDPEQKRLWATDLSGRDAAERRLILQHLATPAWVDRGELMAVYRERDRLAAETGTAHDVDHIIPIVHRLVCGLHVPWNLRPVPRTENHRKSNRWSDGA